MTLKQLRKLQAADAKVRSNCIGRTLLTVAAEAAAAAAAAQVVGDSCVEAMPTLRHACEYAFIVDEGGPFAGNVALREILGNYKRDWSLCACSF
jgi:hypothetical protein